MVNFSLQIHKELNLTLKEYYENYICGTEDEEIQAQDSSSISESSISRPSTSLSLTSVSDPNRWMNRCLFQCNVCGVQFDSRINFKSHVQTIHNLEYDDYIANDGDPTILTNLHGCLMCQEMVICDAEDIAEHLNVAHCMSLEDYHDRFIANDRTIATAKKPKKEKSNFYVNDVTQAAEEPNAADDTYEELLEDNDDDDFGSVFEDDGEELGEDDYNDPLDVIRSPNDIDDIDIEDDTFASSM